MSDIPTTRGNRTTAGGDDPSVAETARTASEEKSREEDNTSIEINRSNTPSVFRIAIDRWIELVLAGVIMVTTIVNVCVANRNGLQWLKVTK